MEYKGYRLDDTETARIDGVCPVQNRHSTSEIWCIQSGTNTNIPWEQLSANASKRFSPDECQPSRLVCKAAIIGMACDCADFANVQRRFPHRAVQNGARNWSECGCDGIIIYDKIVRSNLCVTSIVWKNRLISRISPAAPSQPVI